MNTDALKIVYVSSFPPRTCGIATFTEDLTRAMDDLLEPVITSRIAALNTDTESRFHYSRNVSYQIDSSSEAEYIRCAEQINARPDVKAVNLQHEFGLFGGRYGSFILSFLDALKKPVVVTFHTVLPSPNNEVRSTICTIAQKASGLVTMTGLAKGLLAREYGIPEEKISVIPHGIHSVPYGTSAKAKAALGLSKKTVLLTFGFLNRGKGLEYVIEALPKVVQANPNFIYIILGVTHPNVLKEEGESYRNFLIQKVRELKLSSHVNFYNKYASLEELLQFLKAADIYISTSLNPNHTVSGTFSYALGSGRPVISTRFAQAKELLTPECGFLVDFKSPDAYAEGLIKLLKEPLLMEQLGKNAYFRTRNMTWENVALEYSKLFSKCSPELAEVGKYKKIPRLNLNHLFRLTDDFGMIQFAKLSSPDTASGYTVDDNARALVLMTLCYEKFDKIFKTVTPDKKKTDLLKYIEIYLRFIEFVLGEHGAFYNYVRSGRSINFELNKNENLEDANGRTLWALAVATAADSLPEVLRKKVLVILERRIERYQMMESPRAIAFCVKGFCLLLKKTASLGGRNLKDMIFSHCDRLVSLYCAVSSEEWRWFENYLTYSNAVFPEALLLAHEVTGNRNYLETGLKTLDFLIQQTFVQDQYTPVGQDGWHRKTGIRRHYDQQPEDASAMAYALRTAHLITDEDRYKKLMYVVFNWFLGDNSLKQVVYDRTTGGCYDGVGEGHINLNQGAESTVSYILARLALVP